MFCRLSVKSSSGSMARGDTKGCLVGAVALFFFFSLCYFARGENELRRKKDLAISEHREVDGGLLPVRVDDAEGEDGKGQSRNILPRGPGARQQRQSSPTVRFSKRRALGRSAVLIAISVVVVGVLILLSLRRLGEILLKCLESDGGASKQHDGSTARSLLGSEEKEVCIQLLQENDIGRVVKRGAGGLLRKFSLLRYRNGEVLALIVAFVFLAVVLLRLQPNIWLELGYPRATEPERSTGHYQQTRYVGSTERFPLVEESNNKLTLGRLWEHHDKGVTQGVAPPARFSSDGTTYELFLSAETASELEKEEMADQVRQALSMAPERVGGVPDTLIWGEKSSPDSVLFYAGEGVYPYSAVKYEVYLPKGVFGIYQDKGLPDASAVFAWADLQELMQSASLWLNEIYLKQGAVEQGQRL